MENSAKNSSLDANLSRRLHQALTCGKSELYQVLQDPSMEVLRATFKNPAMDENILLVLFERRDLSEELIKAACSLEAVAASHKLKVTIARNPATPGQIVLNLLPHLYLFELAALCSHPGVTPDQKVAAERAIIQRLPITPLGNKITLARRGTAAVVDALLKEGDVRTVEPCLDNPHLKESSVFQLISSPRTSADTIAAVARHPRWSQRPNLKAAILKNVNTPLTLFSTILPSLSTAELRTMAASGRAGQAQRKLANDELKRRGL